MGDLTIQRISATVAIITYKRIQLLDNALKSLVRQVVEANIDWSILIVDNDSGGSAEHTYLKFASLANIHYVVECTKGLSSARNRALEVVRSHYLLFLDDDETASPEWLSCMVHYARTHACDAVHGPVSPAFTHARRTIWEFGGAFDMQEIPDGAAEGYSYGTGNSLIRMGFVRQHKLRFKDFYDSLGGEDGEFFLHMKGLGANMLWCRRAQITETIFPRKTRLRWMLRRHIRSGQSYYFRTCVHSPKVIEKRIKKLRSKCARNCMRLILLLPKAQSNPNEIVRIFKELCFDIGILISHHTKFLVREYV